ncbi:GNAT family N-acetyltransferase [Terrihalobacillus insolitus]|uniref:GNAT family N-acetyltransferase n=1 Tax=Terrihalobacillus insolitus TaxID=2950438 RepID=UPI0023426FF7|nr:GNAT family N-acetyltransferase [Terrihalobacillus insolitus]MDC3413171.1 GNAT family N-acetyltransferase [Terrihalobacillus insolitus]
MEIIQQWNQSQGDFIREKLIEYNMEKLPEELKTPNKNISFVIKDNKEKIVGGITGNMFWYHLHIDILWVDENIRENGYGSKLLKKMEDFAIEKGCRLIYLDTFSFQAPEFYKKNGYEVFGMLEDHPKGFNQYFLQKRLEA